MIRPLMCLASALLATGCTHNLGVTPMPTDGGASGAVYVLPFTQYTTTLNWRLVDCTPDKIRVALTASAVAGAAPDADQAYVIDPDSLQTLMSIGAFKATWPDGSLMLSSINVSAEDRTGAVIGNVVSAVAKIIPVVRSPAPGGPAPGGAPPACTVGAVEALGSIGVLKPQLDSQTIRVERATAELARLTARSAALGNAVDDETRRLLIAQLDALAALQLDHQILARQLAAALERVTAVQTVRWPTDSRAVSSAAYPISPAAVRRWFGDGRPSIDAFHLRLERVGSFGREPARILPDQTLAGNGVRYRTPAIGRLVICSEAACSSVNRAAVVSELEGPVAQLGFVNSLPVSSRTFGSTVFGAEFTTAGGLRSVG